LSCCHYISGMIHEAVKFEKYRDMEVLRKMYQPFAAFPNQIRMRGGGKILGQLPSIAVNQNQKLNTTDDNDIMR